MQTEELDAKTKILNNAVLLFAANGYKETSVRDISTKAGVNISMISYYFGGKEGILENIVLTVTEGFSFFLDQFDLEKIDNLLEIFEQFLQYLENNRPKIKILFSEIGKDYDYLLPIKIKITELQTKLCSFMTNSKGSENSRLLTRKLKILTDIILGMVFSDYIFDFSNFQEGIVEEKNRWRTERIDMLIKILRQLSGINSGQLSFDPIL